MTKNEMTDHEKKELQKHQFEKNDINSPESKLEKLLSATIKSFDEMSKTERMALISQIKTTEPETYKILEQCINKIEDKKTINNDWISKFSTKDLAKAVKRSNRASIGTKIAITIPALGAALEFSKKVTSFYSSDKLQNLKLFKKLPDAVKNGIMSQDTRLKAFGVIAVAILIICLYIDFTLPKHTKKLEDKRKEQAVEILNHRN